MSTNPYDEGLDRQDLPMPIQEVGDERLVKTDLGKVSPTPRGVYNASTTYSYLDIVQYEGCSYISRKDRLIDVPPFDGEDWMLLTDRNGCLPLAGGTMAGDLVAWSEPRHTACVRNIEVRDTDVDGEPQSTDKIIMVRA